jgi:hypothetical protein
MGMRNSGTESRERTKLGLTLEQSAQAILAHVSGDIKLRTRRIVLPDLAVIAKNRKAVLNALAS